MLRLKSSVSTRDAGFTRIFQGPQLDLIELPQAGGTG
jgi:hypothetical protein